jgi:TRAP-type C4-dicarboxylate transport system permease small subunit
MVTPKRLQAMVRRTEDGLLATAVLAMVALAALQIVLRAGFDGGLAWIEPALRALVLWIGMLGAITASRSGRHIHIDILTRIVSPAWHHRLEILACVFTAAVCALIAWHGIRFVRLELEFPAAAFAGIPSWAVALILPVAFGLIGLRYALAAAELLRGREAFPDRSP